MAMRDRREHDLLHALTAEQGSLLVAAGAEEYSVDMTNRLHKRLKELRANHELTQAALAKCAGVTLSYISRPEIGRHDSQLSTLTKLDQALKITVVELLE